MISTRLEYADCTQKTLREFVEGAKIEPKVLASLRDSRTKEVQVVKVGRNEPCPCGSGDKFKKCCLWKVGCGAEVVK